MRARIGLTGGIGSGKSEVARLFARFGALVIDADALAREGLAPGSEGLRAVAARWPQTISADGTLDRAALGRIVFEDDAARAALNAIVHPVVRKRAAELEARASPGQLVVHEVPLLFETGYDRGLDANVLVVAPLEQRIERVARRSGLSRAEILRRMATQIDPERARALADYTLENDGSLERLQARAQRLHRELVMLAPQPPEAG